MGSPKILFIGGTHPRHLYYANQIHIRYPLAGAVIQDRGGMIPDPPANMGHDAILWGRHFSGREFEEDVYFGEQSKLITEKSLMLSGVELNNPPVVNYIKKINPDIALIFGCGMIKGELAEALPELTINLHLGLSPKKIVHGQSARFTKDIPLRGINCIQDMHITPTLSTHAKSMKNFPPDRLYITRVPSNKPSCLISYRS